MLEISASPYSAGQPPFNTIGGERGQIIWEQDTFNPGMDISGGPRGTQFAGVDVDTTTRSSGEGDTGWLTSGPVMRVGLYTGEQLGSTPI